MEKQRGLRRLSDELTNRKNKAMRADSKRSKKHLDRHDSDGRAKIDLARLTGKDAVAGTSETNGKEYSELRMKWEGLNILRKKACDIPARFKSRRNYILKRKEVIGMGNKTLVIPADS